MLFKRIKGQCHFLIMTAIATSQAWICFYSLFHHLRKEKILMDTTIVMWTKITSNRRKLPSIHALSSLLKKINPMSWAKMQHQHHQIMCHNHQWKLPKCKSFISNIWWLDAYKYVWLKAWHLFPFLNIVASINDREETNKTERNTYWYCILNIFENGRNSHNFGWRLLFTHQQCISNIASQF